MAWRHHRGLYIIKMILAQSKAKTALDTHIYTLQAQQHNILYTYKNIKEILFVANSICGGIEDY